MKDQATLALGDRMTDLHFNWIGFDQRRKSVLFACREAVEYKAVKLQTSSTVILPCKVSVFW